MISRFFSWGLLLGLGIIFAHWISTVTPYVHRVSQLQQLTIMPFSITASQRNGNNIRPHQGKGFIVMSDNQLIGYTAKHVISDTNYIYQTVPASTRSGIYFGTSDRATISLSGSMMSGSIMSYSGNLESGFVLLGLYRNNDRTRNKAPILGNSGSTLLINHQVLPGDSGSPVIISLNSWGVVSKSLGDTSLIEIIQ